MASYALDFSGGGYVQFPLWSTNFDFVMEGRIDRNDATEVIFGCAASNQCYIANIAGGDFRIRFPNDTFNIAGVPLGEDKPFRIERIDGVVYYDIAGVTGSFNCLNYLVQFDYFNFWVSASLPYGGKLYDKVTLSQIDDDRSYDFTASDHAASDPDELIVLETVQGLNGAGVGMLKDGSAWVEIAGGITEPISFDGNIENQTPLVTGEFRLDVASEFSGTQTPFIFTIDPPVSGVTIENDSEVVIAQPTIGTLPVDVDIVVRGIDTDLDVAFSNSFNVNWDASPWGETRQNIEDSDTTGDARPPFLVNDFDVNDLPEDRFSFVVITNPTSGSFYANPLSWGLFSGAADGEYTAVYEGFKNGLSYGTATINLEIIAVTSTLNLTINNIPNGTYDADFYNDASKTLIETRSVTFTDNTLSESLPVSPLTPIFGKVDGDNMPVNGAPIYGVTDEL